MPDIKRRDFLKVVGLTGTGAMVGCSSESARTLIPYIIPQDDIVPGKASWYATTCRECPAGCGMLARNREGRVVKVEGNPHHPVNRGSLCARGQASLHGLYNPDRFKGPMKKNASGGFDPISWETALHGVCSSIADIRKSGRKKGGIVFLSELIDGALKDLAARWLSAFDGEDLVLYEPISYEPLKQAAGDVFGTDDIPAYRLDKADFILSFGADFLETWLSPVEYARQYADFRAKAFEEGGGFVFVGPRLSLTAANADRWVRVPPGGESFAAEAILKAILDEDLASGPNREVLNELKSGLSDRTLEDLSGACGLDVSTIRDLAQQFAKAKNPVALPGALSDPNGRFTAAASFYLNAVVGGNSEAFRFNGPSAMNSTASAAEMTALVEKMNRGGVDVLFIHNANPVYALPKATGFQEALKKVPLIVSFSGHPDETTKNAHLILPAHSPLESWGDYAPRAGVRGLMQPVMGTMFDTRRLGDVLLATAKAVFEKEGVAVPPALAAEDFYAFLKDTWRRDVLTDADIPFEKQWHRALMQGGYFEDESAAADSNIVNIRDVSFPKPEENPENTVRLIAYPSIHLFDGRGANKPWLQEFPDPITNVTWGNWVEIHPDTAEGLGVEKGDLLEIESPHGVVRVPAYLYHGAPENALCMPLGQGHTDYGRFASEADPLEANVMNLLSPDAPDANGASGGWIWTVPEVKVNNTGKKTPLANTDGSPYQFDRGLAQAVEIGKVKRDVRAGVKPHLHLPLPEGYDPKVDFYSYQKQTDIRWAMVVDLDRCIGCGACQTACNAENNVAVVGKKRVLEGREMFWLRIERYFEDQGPPVRFLPVMCQHCDAAPCESVCPIYAPHHSVEGLNNQIYNRCVGTRFCSQNCPYKVRRFNWFTFTRPGPLNRQLNPDVTVRQKGVMEKCSFCVQRIKEVKNLAKNEGRAVKDGEVRPACVQTCPTEALVFGNLKDPGSKVSQLVKDPRTYQVLAHLNTKPAVFYLKRISGRIELA